MGFLSIFSKYQIIYYFSFCIVVKKTLIDLFLLYSVWINFELGISVSCDKTVFMNYSSLS